MIQFLIKFEFALIPMTTSSKNYPTRVEIKLDNKIGWIVPDQIRTIDKRRILKDFAKTHVTAPLASALGRLRRHLIKLPGRYKRLHPSMLNLNIDIIK